MRYMLKIGKFRNFVEKNLKQYLKKLGMSKILTKYNPKSVIGILTSKSKNF
jgi:hypothetical protein